METIFHEKQEGSLCAKHCLNALLQAPYFTEIDLATLAAEIDNEERSQMAEGGVQTEDYRRFLQQPSSNMDDSGYFSVQVIARALKVWSLELIPYKSQNPLAVIARRDPTTQRAYICNCCNHWFTIRKIGNQWFNLNSLLVGPELISDTYLSLFIAQLQQEGFTIFIIHGDLPDCQADKLLRLHPAVQLEKPELLSASLGSPGNPQEDDEDEQALNETLRSTLAESEHMDNERLQATLLLSLNEFQTASASGSYSLPETSSINQSYEPLPISPDREMSEQEMLEAAIKMSMETS